MKGRTIYISIFVVTTLLILLGLFIFNLPIVDKKKESIKIVFAGDLMLDRGTRKVIDKKGVDFLFEDIHDLLSNQDIVVANFEGTACDSGLTPFPKPYRFRMNPDWLPALASNGITNVCLANNHSSDFGKEGLEQTYQHLIKNKIIPIGYHHGENSCNPVLFEKNNVKLALFSSSFLFENEPCGICHEQGKDLCERVRSFKAQNPGYLVVLCLHWGIEMKQLPENDQQKQAHELINAGADLIIGHHPHVVQPMEKYRGKWIFYSLGNFIFDNNQDLSNRGIFGCFSITQGQIELEEVVPFFIRNSKPLLMNTKEAEQFLDQKTWSSSPIKD